MGVFEKKGIGYKKVLFLTGGMWEDRVRKGRKGTKLECVGFVLQQKEGQVMSTHSFVPKAEV